jgi:DNA-binding CsgD family transcriptional regulator
VAPDAHQPASDQPNQEGLARKGLSQEQPFVGRESELLQLQGAFEAAAGSGGRLVLLVGEPGIGKTALSDQLCRFVSASGGLPLVGHCYEEGSFRPPYQAFVEVFATYLNALDSEALQAELGSSAADLARIVPTLRERLQVSPPAPGDPEEDRWRLLQAAADLLRSAAAKQPLLVVLEDLHDADRGTLDLLLYVARNLHGARILVVGTYRDVQVDRAHPLSAALTELHRASNVARVQMHGLSVDEVHRLLTETSQQTVPQPFAELVQRQTEGNPLFVRETLRFVIDTGLVERRDGALRRVGDQTLAGRIPEGLRDAVGKRLSRLSATTNRVLSVASVIGREFQLDVLSRVLAGPEEGLEAALEEASATAIIEEHSALGASIVYRFSHAFFRQTLYDEIVGPRRIRLHQQVAKALEEVYAHRRDEHASELAEHYSFYSDAANLTQAVRYGELAAKRASDAFAYGEAARQLERALVVQDLAVPGDRTKRCILLLALGETLLPVGETDRVIQDIAPNSFALAEALGDRGLEFRACRLALDAYNAQGGTSSAVLPEYLSWAERARDNANPDSTERIHADLALAIAWMTHSRFQEVRDLRIGALERARRLDDPEALFRSAFWVMNQAAAQHWDERVRLAKEFTGRSRQGVSSRTLGVLLWECGCIQLAQGDRREAEALWGQTEELAERTHAATLPLLVGQSQVVRAVLDGHLEEALGLLARFVERADATGAGVRARSFGQLMLLHPALLLGQADMWLATFEERARPRLAASPFAGRTEAVMRALCLLDLGRVQEARDLAEPLLDTYASASGEDDEERYEAPLAFLQAAVRLGHRDATRVLSQRLTDIAHVCIGDYTYTGVARHLGDAAVLLGERAAARQYYTQALDAAGKIGFRPELALTRVSLAELLLQEGDETPRSDALEHLDLAIPELRDMKMQPALDRALALKGKFEASASAAQLPGRQPTSDTLTAREREIAALMADGLSNHNIAERLVISDGTVEVHVKHILGKLGFRSRAQVAGWVARQGGG